MEDMQECHLIGLFPQHKENLARKTDEDNSNICFKKHSTKYYNSFKWVLNVLLSKSLKSHSVVEAMVLMKSSYKCLISIMYKEMRQKVFLW